jgi:hypothetical protein
LQIAKINLKNHVKISKSKSLILNLKSYVNINICRRKENSKVAFELASYAKKAESLGTTVTAVTVNADDVSELSKYE